jgi:hypothetical protein
MSDHSQQIENYLAAWNEQDPQKRRALIQSVWNENGNYCDPTADVTGHDAFDALVAHVQQLASGLRFRKIGDHDHHHNYLRFTWELAPEQGEAQIVGSDVAQLDHDGRFLKVIGFFDQVLTDLGGGSA